MMGWTGRWCRHYCTISTVGSSRVAQGLRRTQVEPVVAEDVDERPKNRPKKEILIKNLRPPHQSYFDSASIEPIVARTYVASHIDRTYGRNSTVVSGLVIPMRPRTEDWGSAPLSFLLWVAMSITVPRQWSGRTEASLSQVAATPARSR
jgi:hypothetical protein